MTILDEVMLDDAKAEIKRLRASLAAKGGNEDAPEDEVDPSDVDNHTPPKKGKKTKKATDDDPGNDEIVDEVTDEDEHEKKKDALYWGSVKAATDSIVLADARRRGISSAPKPTATEQRASMLDDQLLIMEVRTGFHGDAAHTAKQILACHRAALGQVEPPPMPACGRQRDFEGQDIEDPKYWARVNASAKFILEAHYRARGKKIGD